MMVHGQLGQSQTPPVLFQSPTQQMRVLGLLANEEIQIPSLSISSDTHTAAHRNSVVPAYPAFKLDLLKKQKFTSQGRERRIAISLEALDALSPTKLTAAQWIEIVEEVDDED